MSGPDLTDLAGEIVENLQSRLNTTEELTDVSLLSLLGWVRAMHFAVSSYEEITEHLDEAPDPDPDLQAEQQRLGDLISELAEQLHV